MTTRLAALVSRRPGWVLLAALVVTLVLLPSALRLRLDTDIYDLFPQDAPVSHAFAQFSKAFIAEPVIVVLVESSDGSKLDAFVDPYAEALRASPMIAEVRHRLTGEAARFFRDHLIAFLDETEIDALASRTEPAALRAQLQRIRGLLSAPGGSSLAPILTADPFELLPLVGHRMGGGVAIDTQSGLFKSADGHALLLYVRPRDPGTDPESTRTLLAELGRLAVRLHARVTDGTFTGGSDLEISFTGPSVYALHYRDWLHDDMMRSTLMSGVAVLLLFGLFFRALRVLPLVGLPLFLGVVWTGAIAHMSLHRINAVSLAFGTILISIGIDLPIQLYNRLREELCTLAPREALERTLQHFMGPALLATLGPAAVFAACGLSRFRGLRELGALSALGLVVNCVAMITVFPALLAILPGRIWGARAVPVPRGGAFRALGNFSARWPKAILASAALVFCAALPFALKLRFDRNLFSQPPRMAPSLVQTELEQRFGQRDGAAIAYVEEHARPGVNDAAQLDEAVLQRSDAWLLEAEHLKTQGLLRGYQSLSLLLPSGKLQRVRRARLLATVTPARVAEIRSMLVGLGFDAAPFDSFLSQLAVGPPVHVADLPRELDFLVRLHLHRDPGEARIATYLYPETGKDERASLRAIEESAKKVGGVITGKPLLEPLLRAEAQIDMARATALAALLVAALVFAYYRRWRPAVALLLPLILAWVSFAALLTVLGIELNLFNLLAVPLVIGYGIDDHVFLTYRFEEDPTHDVRNSLASTGRAVVVTTLATMAGFLPIAFARFPALRLLGTTGALAVALCLFAAFFVHPAALVLIVGRREPNHP